MCDRPKILLLGGSGVMSGVASYITGLLEVLGSDVEAIVVAEPDLGGYATVQELGARFVPIQGVSSTLHPMTHRRARTALAQLIAEERPDLVWAHARMAVHLSREIFYKPRTDGVRLAVSLHGLPFGPGHRSVLHHMSKTIETRHMLRAQPHHIHFLSQNDCTQYIGVTGPQSGRHRLHVLGTTSRRDISCLPALRDGADQTLRLIMTTRPGYQKNLQEAARIVAALEVPWKLELYGNGTDDPSLRHTFKRHLGAKVSQVAFRGPIHDVGAALNRADMYLMTSRYEGMAIGVHEAFEAGLPLALSAIPGNQLFLETNPYAAGLALGRPSDSAQKIQRLWLRAKADVHHRERINKIWRASFSPEIWGKQARQMVSEFLERPLSASLR